MSVGGRCPHLPQLDSRPICNVAHDPIDRAIIQNWEELSAPDLQDGACIVPCIDPRQGRTGHYGELKDWGGTITQYSLFQVCVINSLLLDVVSHTAYTPSRTVY